jgi:hypothetical protein
MQGPSEVKEGFGEGSFVVIRAEKSEEGMQLQGA